MVTNYGRYENDSFRHSFVTYTVIWSMLKIVTFQSNTSAEMPWRYLPLNLTTEPPTSIHCLLVQPRPKSTTDCTIMNPCSLSGLCLIKTCFDYHFVQQNVKPDSWLTIIHHYKMYKCLANKESRALYPKVS
jgi:hypothetical protein